MIPLGTSVVVRKCHGGATRSQDCDYGYAWDVESVVVSIIDQYGEALYAVKVPDGRVTSEHFYEHELSILGWKKPEKEEKSVFRKVGEIFLR